MLFLLMIPILVTIVIKCQKPKPSKAALPCRNSVISEGNSSIADLHSGLQRRLLVQYVLAETRKGKMVVRQPVPKGSRYIVSSLPTRHWTPQTLVDQQPPPLQV
ncbi:hypothetical protein KUCAC02_004031 [Chaenocephalus aceratus]|uniref:Uncharacterized protein n=1 Tax=Chaenocephalus aceratus TaxID=36190 RepID=A0ACB9WY26_CHAAC|nr:hypothetical protein KUCAC02_004031 [Chaenocephalus aceratus]